MRSLVRHARTVSGPASPRRRRSATAAPSLALLATLALGACGSRPSSTLDPRSPSAREIAELWWVMLGFGGAVWLLVTLLLVWPAVRGRRRDIDTGADTDTAERFGRRWMAWGGIVLPVVVVFPLSLWSVSVIDRQEGRATRDALVVEVVGHRFWWEVRYPELGAVTANEVHVPVGTDVRFELTTDDVIHSFWAPNLGGKVDMIPGEVTELGISVDEPGTYRGFCAEFCGVQHAKMRLLVVAQEPEEFEEWAASMAADATPADAEVAAAGEDVFSEVGCAGCHTVRGTGAEGDVGPDLTHVGSRRTLGAGIVENDRGHLGGWISNSQSIKPGNLMPPMVLEPDELRTLIDYMEALE